MALAVNGPQGENVPLAWLAYKSSMLRALSDSVPDRADFAGLSVSGMTCLLAVYTQLL